MLVLRERGASVFCVSATRGGMDLRAELEKILHSVGPENIWRPVYDSQNVLLAGGIADMRDGRPQDMSKLDFRGKTVLDLGCNFGFYSFLAKRLGARKVVGVDKDGQVIKGCELLKAMHGVRDVHFYSGDFTTSTIPGTFDIVMLINFLGKVMVTEGIQESLDAAERLCQLIQMIDNISTHNSGIFGQDSRHEELPLK